MSHEDVVTLKMHTLRMLLKRFSLPLVIVDEAAPTEEVTRLVSERTTPLIVVVDSAGALVGTLSRVPARVVVLGAEEEVDETAERVFADRIEYVLVADGNGDLIGLLTAATIASHRSRRAA
jgi:CBS domain-containing protein